MYFFLSFSSKTFSYTFGAFYCNENGKYRVILQRQSKRGKPMSRFICDCFVKEILHQELSLRVREKKSIVEKSHLEI